MYMNICPPLWAAVSMTSRLSALISRAVCKTAQIGGVCSRMAAKSSIKEALSRWRDTPCLSDHSQIMMKTSSL